MPQLDRRQLLKLGTLAGVGLSLGPWLQAREAIEQLPLSVGWVEGSDRWPFLRPLPWEPLPGNGHLWQPGAEDVVSGLTLSSAESLDADMALVDRWIKIRVFGLYPGLAEPGVNSFRSVNLIHWQGSKTPGETHPVLVWGARREPGNSLGAPVSYRYLLDQVGLRFAVELTSVPDLKGRKGGAAAPIPAQPNRILSAQLSAQDVGGALRRGVYFLGLEPGLWQAGGELLPPTDPLAWTQSSIVLSVELLPNPTR